MIDKKIVESLKKRYSHIHPLIFHRSVERAKSGGDLFDILDSFEDRYPVVWGEKEGRWVVSDDVTQSTRFELNN